MLTATRPPIVTRRMPVDAELREVLTEAFSLYNPRQLMTALAELYNELPEADRAGCRCEVRILSPEFQRGHYD
jgi:hypothetical protein